jgi:carboxypeptidase Q
MRLRLLIITAVVVLTCVVAGPISLGQGQNRGPSTPAEREQALRITRALETDPLNEKAKDARRWLFVWLAEVPDISVTVCTDFIKPVASKDKNYATEISAQMMFSSAAFIIEHPDQAKDKGAVYQAGLEGSLKAYESILKTKPDAKWPFLDGLIEKREKGELGAYVEETLKKGKCSK